MKFGIDFVLINYILRRKNNIFLLLGILCLLTIQTFSQSSDQNLPTPITSNQITGEIKARDIGDSRLTPYYYIFNGNRGDIFINVVTTNLNGDIDIFTAEGIRPKTKITLYADSTENETGRVIYMRQAEKLILRIQGRTPNDDVATFQIKFAGSFAPIEGIALNEVPVEPKIISSNNSKVKVNSVGTIIEQPETESKINEVTIDDTDKIDEKVADNKDANAEIAIIAKKAEIDTKENSDTKVDKENTEPQKAEISTTFDPTIKVDDIIKSESKSKKPQVIISDSLTDTKENESKTEQTDVTVDLVEKPKNISAIVRIERVPIEESKAVVEKKEETLNPLSKIFLKVELKNGETFERSMAEVLSMNVIKGILTIVTSDGKIQEYSILDVIKMTVQ